MIGIVTALCITQALIADALPASFEPTPDDGAGIIQIGISPCQNLGKTDGRPACAEPQIANDADNATRVKGLLDRAWYFIFTRDMRRALVETDQALLIEANSAKARHLAARIALTLRELPRARRELARAIDAAPNDPDIEATKVSMAMDGDNDQETLRAFDAILATAPQQRFARIQRLQIERKLRRFDAAIDDCSFLIRSGYMPVLMLEIRASLMMEPGRYDRAAADFSSALALRPNNYTLLKARAIAFAKADQDEKSVADYNTLLAKNGINPAFAMSKADRIGMLLKRLSSLVTLKRTDAATRDALEAIHLGGPQAMLRTQIALRRQGYGEVSIGDNTEHVVRQAMNSCLRRSECYDDMMRIIDGPL